MQLIDPQGKAALPAEFIEPARLRSAPRILPEADEERAERRLRRGDIMDAKKAEAGIRRIGDAADAPREQIAAAGDAPHAERDISFVARQAEPLPRAQDLDVGLTGGGIELLEMPRQEERNGPDAGDAHRRLLDKGLPGDGAAEIEGLALHLLGDAEDGAARRGQLQIAPPMREEPQIEPLFQASYAPSDSGRA